MKFIAKEKDEGIPRHLTKKGGSEYIYPHSFPHGYVPQKYMYPNIKFYDPVERGHERLIKKYLSFIQKQNEKNTKS
ncbi:MAG: replication-associated recombination protein A, partial [Elusimicrobia bacterium]|nr:replication-associated recombination protein A [Elusimicrobiota bacterium]